jgi:hypothetical protein
MAQPSGTSQGYMQIGMVGQFRGWKHSQWKTNQSMSCLSLIEVADMRHRKKLITGGFTRNGVNVAMENSLVVTRYLFFYPTGPSKPLTVVASDLSIKTKEFKPPDMSSDSDSDSD